jgi:maltooligosyltrehalose trehalohydrolase
MTEPSLTVPLQSGSDAKDWRQLPIGAEVMVDGVSFRVWAPARTRVDVFIEGMGHFPLAPEQGGYHAACVIGAAAGMRYRFKLDEEADLFADPASRFQPEGPGGPSVIVDPKCHVWHDRDWNGVEPHGQVIYEMHVGTFTAEGTWAAAAAHFEKLKAIGITIVEIMPIHEFSGEFGWGYDGVLLYAPTRLYGTPDDLRSFVDKAHAIGLAVILDVVYNHFGGGDQHGQFSPDYFTDRYINDWGRSINFDGPGSEAVRELITKNAGYWISEYHFDGLRLDATQALFDSSEEHIIAAITREARAAACIKKSLYLVGENEPQDTLLVRGRGAGGYELTSVWNDDFHHSAMVALTGRGEAYYHDYKGAAQEFVSAAKYGYLFQGQRYDWQDHMRGTPGLELDAMNFVHFLQNHDQVANSALGQRLTELCSPARVRAATALLLLGPQTPMLFQGQEFFCSKPFLYFADVPGDMGEQVRSGRQQSLAQFPSLNDPATIDALADPVDRKTYEGCKLDWAEYERNQHAVALHRDLLKLRRQETAFSSANLPVARKVDGGVLSPSAFYLRYFADDRAGDVLLIVNFGADLPISSVADPLLAPALGHVWSVHWSSESPVYGGGGQRPVDFDGRWTLTADTALILKPTSEPEKPAPTKDELNNWQVAISK